MTSTATAEVEAGPDPRDPELRLRNLLDADTLIALAPRDDSGVFAVRGRIDGNSVTAFATDATKMGGAMGWVGCVHIVTAIETAMDEGIPVIGLWHSGGA